MKSYELYQRLIADLKNAKQAAAAPALKKKLERILQPLGTFLCERSLVFEMLEKQDDVDVFLSMCRSNMKNLILVFDHYLSDQALMNKRGTSSKEFLLTLLNNFNEKTDTISKAHLSQTNRNAAQILQLAEAA